MKKYPLIGISIVAVVLLVLGSLTNVVGYQQVQSSNQGVVNNEADPKELLFQTIVDIANNKEIQRIILKSEISRGRFFDSDARLSIVNTPVLTKNSLKQMYFIGLMLSKFISKSRINSLIDRYQVSNQRTQREVTAVIEENDTLNKEMNQLMGLHCDCEKNSTTIWHFLVLCVQFYFRYLFF